MIKLITDAQAKQIIGGGHRDYKAGEITGRVLTNIFGGKIIKSLRRW